MKYLIEVRHRIVKCTTTCSSPSMKLFNEIGKMFVIAIFNIGGMYREKFSSLYDISLLFAP